MTTNDTAEQDYGLDEFRALALRFLEANAARKTNFEQSGWGIGPDAIGLLDGHSTLSDEVEAIKRSRAWRRSSFDSGFAWASGPRDLGGGGRNKSFDQEYRLLEHDFDVPDQQPFATGTHLVAPAILAYGSAEVQQKYLPGIFRGDLIACQLLSEPEAGSDLSALRIQAVRDGDEWVVTGQKVWSSQAHFSQVGQLLARTSNDLPKNAGITMFIVDMASPGITVRPIKQMTGETHFNEVFFDDVRVPDANRVGPEGFGWKAIMATLMAERVSVGSGANNSAVDAYARLVDLARALEREYDPVVRQKLAAIYTNGQLRRFLVGRHQVAVATGGTPGPEGSILKLLFCEHANLCSALAADLLGAQAIADSGQWGTFAWARWITGAPMMRIAGGTDEIQKNTLAERVLRLPKEPAS